MKQAQKQTYRLGKGMRVAHAKLGRLGGILMSVDIKLYGVSPDERKCPQSECGKGMNHGGGGGGGGN